MSENTQIINYKAFSIRKNSNFLRLNPKLTIYNYL